MRSIGANKSRYCIAVRARVVTGAFRKSGYRCGCVYAKVRIRLTFCVRLTILSVTQTRWC
jgi:hypothetical protein